ncbi:proteasome regulatory subunit carboxy-terminal protein, partial [Gregarina niphandrodes]
SPEDSLTGNEAALTFNKRITFCSDMYKDAVRALQYPEEESLKARAAEAERRRKQQAEERTRAEAEEGYDDDEF